MMILLEQIQDVLGKSCEEIAKANEARLRTLSDLQELARWSKKLVDAVQAASWSGTFAQMQELMQCTEHVRVLCISAPVKR